MKLNIGKFNDSETDRLAIKLTQILSNVNLDNIKYRIINGVTDVVPDTERMFPHGLSPRPWLAVPVSQTGGVYVKEINNTSIDIRSTKSSATFSMLVLD